MGRKPNDDVSVNSHTYGKHTRAARGTMIPAIINDVLAAHAAKTEAINAAAKAVYDVLKIYTTGFRGGQLWQHILSRMRNARSMHFEDLLRSLGGMEINSRYALARFGSVPEFAIEMNRKNMQTEMKPLMPPHLNKKDNCYQYELFVLLFSGKGVCIQHAMQQTKWINDKEAPGKQVFNFEKPANTKYYLLCLHLQGGINGIATDVLGSRGMALMFATFISKKQ